MEIVNNFLSLIESKSDQPDSVDVDITDFVKQNKCFTPTGLKNSEDSYSDMPGVIVMNFCQNSKGMYPMYGLRAISRIISKDLDEDDTKAQLMLLVHVTKMVLSINASALYCERFEKMVTTVDNTARLEKWNELAVKTLGHGEINKTINKLMVEVFGTEYSGQIAETATTTVSVKFVDTFETHLRGFTGIDCIFINERHFTQKMMAGVESIEREKIMAIDIITLALHEYAHARIRQVFDNFNMSTPKAMITSTTAQDIEFGRIVEIAFFKVPVDWLNSFTGCETYQFIESFIDAIETNSSLPVLPNTANLQRRTAPIVMSGGADLAFELTLD